MMRPAPVWRHLAQRYRLEAARCSQCGKLHFPPRSVCSVCRGRKFEKHLLAGKGELVTFSIVHVGPAEFQDQLPYAVGIVELDEGVRLTCQLAEVASDELRIGMRVRLELRRVRADGEGGVIAYGYKAVPEI